MSNSQVRKTETKNVSLPPVIKRALSGLAARAGHGNESRIVQELVAREATFQYGPDWAERFEEPVQTLREAQVA
jgi:hypothetical protein